MPVSAEVECADGPGGHSAGVIVRPTDQQVTHVIVKPHGDLPRLAPVEQIIEASPSMIRLRCTRDELAHMDPFIEHEYMTLLSDVNMWTWEPQMIPVAHRRIPKGELAIERGSRVVATDGQVGEVDELLVDPQDEHITHLVLREGHLWGQRDVTIPARQIDHIEDDAVFLNLDKHAVAALPAVPVHK
jgi:sporulation protein YlmC with PRC-barrel domain